MIALGLGHLVEVKEPSFPVHPNRDGPIEHVEVQAFDAGAAVVVVVAAAWRPFAFVVVEDLSVGVFGSVRGFVGNAVVAVDR